MLRKEGPFAGVLGFSQGAAAAAMVTSLLEPGRRGVFNAAQPHGGMEYPASFVQQDSEHGNGLIHPPLRFGAAYSGFAASDRIFDFMDRRPRVRANSEGRRLDTVRQGIEFRDVCFSYDPDNPILTNVHLHVRAGETVAMVGKNGCGKTTLVGLLPRFYDPDHGAVLIDGFDVRKLSLRSLPHSPCA